MCLPCCKLCMIYKLMWQQHNTPTVFSHVVWMDCFALISPVNIPSAGDLCPVGTYNNLTGLRAANECAPCDPGYYCPNQGIVVPDKLCSAGHYCELGSTEPAPVAQSYGYLCPVGHYCPEGTTAPVPCSAGFYQPNTGRVCVGWGGER